VFIDQKCKQEAYYMVGCEVGAEIKPIPAERVGLRDEEFRLRRRSGKCLASGVATPSGLFLERATGCGRVLMTFLLWVVSLCGIAPAQTGSSYQVTNLISDGSVTAATTDPKLINPWGIGIGSTIWISGEKSGLEFVSTATGSEKFDVNIPAASGSGTGQPTGVIFSGTAKGFVLPVGAPPTFLFATHDGAIAGWNAALGMNDSTAQIVINNSQSNAAYTGLALLNNAAGTFLLATNFGQASDIEVYNTAFQPAKLAGNFTDPNLPANYSPFSIHVIGDQVFVAYALRATTTTNGVVDFKQTVGAGDGILDVYDLNGNFVATAVSGGNLNAPWGVAIAPSGFGVFAGDLLVGNFGDGIINVYNLNTYAFLGQIVDSTGKAVAFPSLWEIVFGQSDATPPGAGDPNTLFFASGLTNAAHGLFGTIANAANSTAAPTFGFSASTSAATIADGSSTKATVSVVPTNGFTGNVSLSCSTPAGITCTFSSSPLAASATEASTSEVVIQTTPAMANLQHRPFWHGVASVIETALLIPFGSLVALSFRRTAKGKKPLLFLGFGLLFLAGSISIVGCSSSDSTSSMATTPTGVQQITIKATSGSITQTTTIALTVQ
jgi:uncharacterized protein (TIGR03118 family)